MAASFAGEATAFMAASCAGETLSPFFTVTMRPLKLDLDLAAVFQHHFQPVLFIITNLSAQSFNGVDNLLSIIIIKDALTRLDKDLTNTFLIGIDALEQVGDFVDAFIGKGRHIFFVWKEGDRQQSIGIRRLNGWDRSCSLGCFGRFASSRHDDCFLQCGKL